MRGVCGEHRQLCSYIHEKELEAEEGGKGAAVVGRGIDSTVGVAEVDTGILSSNVRFLDPFEGERLSRKSSALPDNDNGAFCS